MSLIDDLSGRAPGRKKGGATCAAAVYLATLDSDTERAIIQTRLLDHDWPYASLDRVFKKHGVPIPKSTIQRHRKLECNCPQNVPDLFDPEWLEANLPDGAA